MFSNIEKLQKKPDYIKRRIALLTALVLFLIIISTWFLVSDIKPTKKKSINPTENISSPFENFKNIFINIKDDAKTKFDSIKEQYSFDEPNIFK